MGRSTAHPQPGSVIYEADVRRPDGSLYAVYKRLQEEMCQFFDAFALPIIVLVPTGGRSELRLRHGTAE